MHEAWAARKGPDWAPLAPGVEFLLRRLDGPEEAAVHAGVARAMASIVDGRATLEAFGFEDDALGVVEDLDLMAGLSVFLFAVSYLEKALDAWRGIEDADGGAVEISRASIHAALRWGAPEASGSALLMPFMAWVEGPRRPLGAEKKRLRDLANWEWKGGGSACDGCDLANSPCARMGTDDGALCPRVANAPQTVEGIAAWEIAQASGLWVRAGMTGALAGLDYRSALEIGSAREGLAAGRLFECFRAIEAGAVTGAAAKAEAEAEAAKAGEA